MDPAPSMEKLEQYILEALELLHGEKKDVLQKYERLSDRFMHALELGATGKFLKFLTRKYKSHRTIPSDWVTHLDQSFEEFLATTNTKYNESAIDDFVGVRDTACRQELLKKLRKYHSGDDEEKNDEVGKGDKGDGNDENDENDENDTEALQAWLKDKEDNREEPVDFDFTQSAENEKESNSDGDEEEYPSSPPPPLPANLSLTDEQVAYAMTALQLDVSGSDWQRGNIAGNFSTPLVIPRALSADCLLSAMADRTASDRGIADDNHTVGIEGTNDVALAMVNTKSRDVLTPEENRSLEDYNGGIHWSMAACRREGKHVCIQMLDPLSSVSLSEKVLKAVKVPSQEDIDKQKAKNVLQLNISNNLTADWTLDKKEPIALGWQNDGFRCAYYILYAMLHAVDSTLQQQEGWFRCDNLSEKFKKMPIGT